MQGLGGSQRRATNLVDVHFAAAAVADCLFVLTLRGVSKRGGGEIKMLSHCQLYAWFVKDSRWCMLI